MDIVSESSGLSGIAELHIAVKQCWFSAHVLVLQVASALMYIHSRKILHRDLKTQNIFIARGSIVKLGDFGISKARAICRASLFRLCECHQKYDMLKVLLRIC